MLVQYMRTTVLFCLCMHSCCEPFGSIPLKVGYWGMFAWARARSATFVLRILALALSLSSPREAPQVDPTGLQTFPAKHVWAEWLHHPCLLGGPQ